MLKLRQIEIIKKSFDICVYKQDYEFKHLSFVGCSRRDKRGSLLTKQSHRSANDAVIYSLATNWFAKFAKTNFGIHRNFAGLRRVSCNSGLFTSAQKFTTSR